jgi:prepilin-type N-terminal cleavage/methylation domain-containing protein
MKALQSRGFTFLELIVSLAITSMVMVMVYATFHVAFGATDRSEVRSVENQRARASLSFIARQLKSAYPLVLQAEGSTYVYFFGEKSEISFVAATGRPEAGGLEKITFFLRDQDGHRSLWLRTSAPTMPVDLINDREGALRQEAQVLPEVDGVTWEFLRRTPEKDEWLETWNGKNERQLPIAVRLSWRARLGDLPHEWQIEVPINVPIAPPELMASPQSGGVGRRRRRNLGTGARPQ